MQPYKGTALLVLRLQSFMKSIVWWSWGSDGLATRESMMEGERRGQQRRFGEVRQQGDLRPPVDTPQSSHSGQAKSSHSDKCARNVQKLIEN